MLLFVVPTVLSQFMLALQAFIGVVVMEELGHVVYLVVKEILIKEQVEEEMILMVDMVLLALK